MRHVVSTANATWLYARQVKMPWRIIVPAANISGSLGGTCLALKHGSAFVHQVFLLLLGIPILKFAWDTVALF
ncbi:MAG TPA: hypothetical protein VLA64_10750 [Azonexus sp.]|nr:hypothetical protein [Azonexus sp.]